MAVHFAVKTCPQGVDDPDDPRYRILIVDDQESMHRAFKHLFELRISQVLTTARVEVVSAFTLKDGLALAAGANCTLLDLTLKDSDSENTRGHIKDFRPPVIVLTGDDDPATAADCKAKGAARVFVKGQIYGLIEAVLDCFSEDLKRLNPELVPNG